MSPAVARGLQPGARFRYCGLCYTLAEVYVAPQGQVFLQPVPSTADVDAGRAPVMFPADQCDLERRPIRTPAKRNGA